MPMEKRYLTSRLFQFYDKCNYWQTFCLNTAIYLSRRGFKTFSCNITSYFVQRETSSEMRIFERAMPFRNFLSASSNSLLSRVQLRCADICCYSWYWSWSIWHCYWQPWIGSGNNVDEEARCRWSVSVSASAADTKRSQRAQSALHSLSHPIPHPRSQPSSQLTIPSLNFPLYIPRYFNSSLNSLFSQLQHQCQRTFPISIGLLVCHWGLSSRHHLCKQDTSRNISYRPGQLDMSNSQTPRDPSFSTQTACQLKNG